MLSNYLHQLNQHFGAKRKGKGLPKLMTRVCVQNFQGKKPNACQHNGPTQWTKQLTTSLEWLKENEKRLHKEYFSPFERIGKEFL